MAFRIEDIQKRALELLIDGTGLYAGKKVVEFIKPYTVKHLKQYNDPAVKIAISLVDLVFPRIAEIPYVGDWMHLWGKMGIKELEELLIDKPALCWAEDPNSIRCINFDTTAVTVKINGAPVTATISGTAEDFTISLPSPLSAGEHDLVVVGNTKAFSGKIYV